MTTSTDRIEEIFQDARELQADALEMLAQGRVRNAAEKVLGRDEPSGPADAPVLARTGEEHGADAWRPSASTPEGWHPWTKPCGKPACCAATTAGRSVTPWRVLLQRPLRVPWMTRSAGSGKRADYIEDAERLAEGETPS